MAVELLAPITEEQGVAGLGAVSLRRVAEAARRGRAAEVSQRLRVQETMTTSDFTHMADLIDRGLMRGYLSEAIPTTYQTLGYRRDTSDLARAGGNGRGRDYQINGPRMIPRVAEKGEYKPLDPTETYYEFTTYKYGCQWDLSWEAWLADNRDLGLLREYPDNWGLSARYTQEYLFTSAYAASASLFTSGNGNLAEAGSALAASTLSTGITALRNFTDPSGNTAVYGGKIYLVVPPALEITGRQLVDPSWIIANQIVATAAEASMLRSCELVVAPFLPVIDTTYGDTSWYLFCDPRLRAAVRYGHLRGYEQPEVWMKDSDAKRIASGASDPFDGSFLTDDIAFKLRFFFGANAMDWRGAYRATGQS